MMCVTDCGDGSTAVRGAGFKMRDPTGKLQKTKGCSVREDLAVVRNITPPRDPALCESRIRDQHTCPAPKTSRICKLLQELYHHELVSQRLKQAAIKPYPSTVERKIQAVREQVNAAMQELSKLREAITYCDEQAALLHQQRKDLTDEIKQAEEQHKCDLDSAMKEYIFYRKEVDSFHEEADGSVVDLGQISAEVEQWKTTRNQWKSDQLAIEPEYYRLSAESQRLECKRSYLDRALLLIGKSIERMELAIGLCEEEYNESPIQKGVNQLQRLCQAALLRKSQLDDALTHRYLAEDDSHNMRNAVVHAERTYPVKGLSNTDAYASVAEQQLQLDRTSLQLILQQAEIVQLTAKEEKLLQKRAKLDKQQVDIIFKLDPESDFAVEGRRLHNNLDTAMDRYGSLQDDIFRTNNDVHQNTMALREREHHIEEAEIYITSLKTKILKEEEQIDNIKKRTTETFQTTVTDLRQQVQHLLRQAEQEFESNKPCKSILDLT